MQQMIMQLLSESQVGNFSLTDVISSVNWYDMMTAPLGAA